MARKSAVPGLPAASDLTLDEFLAIYPPMAGADDAAGDDADADDADDAAGADDDAGSAEEKDIDWKAMARKHERNAKKLLKEKADFEKALKEREDADKSEHEKAIEKAREEGRTQALTEAEKSRRADRLELATTRLAAKGVEIGEKTVKFSDPEDAHVFIERAIAKGDLDADDIYDSEGKVQTDALSDALADLLRRKPNLAADSVPRPKGDADAGKGGGSSDGSPSSDPEEHFKALRKK